MKQVADALDISESYYSMIEGGSRQNDLKASTLKKLSKLYRCSVDELLDALPDRKGA